jgi:cation diffusion facilitator family transporter
MTSALTFFGEAKRSVKNGIKKLKSFQQSLIRHSTPLTRKYFFKNENAADRVTLLGLWINISLSVIKFVGGVLFNSAVLVADAGHSLSDLFSDFITLWAVQVARLPADDDHPYGHGKFEAVGSLLLSLVLLFTGVGVGSWSYERMNQVLSAPLHAASKQIFPSPPAMVLALLSIVSKEWLFRVTKRVGDALNNQVIIANAWHHRSDAFSSILSLGSIALAIFFPGFLIADSAAGIFIAGMICMTGLEILGESMKQLTDTSDQTLNIRLIKLAESVDGVQEVKSVRARSIGRYNHNINSTVF